MKKTSNGRQSVDALIKSICNTMRRGDMAGAMDYVPELSWLLFLRVLDETENKEQQRSAVLGVQYTPSLQVPYRWCDWAAKDGDKRGELTAGAGGALLRFVNQELLPHLKKLRNRESGRQKVISQVFRGIERTRFTSQRDLLDVLDKLDDLRQDNTDDTHIFLLSQVYENLLLKMGEKNNDGGQYFTPREVIRAMVQVIAPKVGERVYDPCCGTGGFLAQANEYMRAKKGGKLSADDINTLQQETFYGRENEKLIYPITIANLVLHGIDVPHIWHGNTLTRIAKDATLYPAEEDDIPADVILTNPPFGGKEATAAQTRFSYKTAKTQVLFLQEVIASLKQGGRCGIVMDEGLLFQINDRACADTKRHLLEKCNVWCIISLPPGVFKQAGAGVKTNIMFFSKGRSTKSIWYYDLSQIKVTKRQPLMLTHFDEFFQLLPKRANSANSWTVDIETIKANKYDIKAVNPNRKSDTDTRTPAQLLSAVDKHQKELTKALKKLQGLV